MNRIDVLLAFVLILSPVADAQNQVLSLPGDFPLDPSVPTAIRFEEATSSGIRPLVFRGPGPSGQAADTVHSMQGCTCLKCRRPRPNCPSLTISQTRRVSLLLAAPSARGSGLSVRKTAWRSRAPRLVPRLECRSGMAVPERIA